MDQPLPEDGVIAGCAWFERCFTELDPDCEVFWHVEDGEGVTEDSQLCEITGNARAMLSAERAALNFLQTLSAIATTTRRFVTAAIGTKAQILDTRKTLPGLRMASKYAVHVGGGHNHRIGLFDGILIKENHILVAGGIAPALKAAFALVQHQAPADTMIEIEVETLDQLQQHARHRSVLHVGNPPYDVLEKDRGKSSWPHVALSGYTRVHTDYEAALGGKLNLFRFFIVRSLALLRHQGRFGMIVPMAILADISCAKTRRHVMLSTSDISADCFPQKDNRHRRVFLEAKLSTVILTCSRAAPKTADASEIHIRVYPWNSFDDPCRESVVRFADTALIDPANTPIPLSNAKDWELCRKIHSLPHVVRLADVTDFAITRGEINQTVYREFITSDKRMSRLLKGSELGQYQLKDSPKQGIREWFNATAYARQHNPKANSRQRRIATQRITGVDERLRVVAMIIDPPAYFADSTNSITVSESSDYRLEFLLGMLNSTLFQWRFKLTSTNNNVGTNELEGMPFRTIRFNDAAEKVSHDSMVGFVEQLMTTKQMLTTAKSDRDKNFYEAKCSTLERKINALVYKLYAVSEEGIRIIEECGEQPAD